MPGLRPRHHVLLRRVRCDLCVCHPVVAGALTSGANQIRARFRVFVSVVIVVFEKKC